MYQFIMHNCIFSVSTTCIQLNLPSLFSTVQKVKEIVKFIMFNIKVGACIRQLHTSRDTMLTMLSNVVVCCGKIKYLALVKCILSTKLHTIRLTIM